MGLFDKRDKKRKSDDFDSPVEKIDLSAPQASEPVEAAAAPAAAAAAPIAAGSPMAVQAPQAQPEPRAAVRRAPEPEPEYDDGDYDSSFGIQKAIDLMRTLPQDNVELVVQVVKLTLESTKIKISHIIEDATRKQDDIQGRIKVLKGEISDFEKEIAQRREEIGGLETDYEETTMVKDRLQLAEKITNKDSAAGKTLSSGGKDQANAAGTIGSARPALGGAPSKTSVVIKK